MEIILLLYIHKKGTGKSYTAIAFAMEYIFKSVMNPSLFNFESPLVLYIIKYGSWANDLRQIYQLNDEDFTQKSFTTSKTHEDGSPTNT